VLSSAYAIAHNAIAKGLTLPDYATTLVIAAGLWYLLFVRFSRHQRSSDGFLYWTGRFVYDPARSVPLRAAVAILNIAVVYAIVLAALWLRSR
jgi:hypothetical protein